MKQSNIDRIVTDSFLVDVETGEEIEIRRGIIYYPEPSIITVSFESSVWKERHVKDSMYKIRSVARGLNNLYVEVTKSMPVNIHYADEEPVARYNVTFKKVNNLEVMRRLRRKK